MTWDPTTATSAMRSVEAAFLIGVEGATEIWLIRHADCYEALSGADVGEGRDPPLSPLGREQARRLGERLAGVRIDGLYSSPLRRARETASAIREDFGLDPRLVEAGADTSSGRVKLVEPPEQVLERMSAAVADTVAAHPGGRVAIVGHGVAILVYLCDVLNLEFGQLRLLPYYTSVSVVRVLDERRMVGWLGDTGHLVE